MIDSYLIVTRSGFRKFISTYALNMLNQHSGMCRQQVYILHGIIIIIMEMNTGDILRELLGSISWDN